MSKQLHNQVQIFEHEQFGKVRVFEIDGQPWFVGKDVSDILGYTNSRKALNNHVDGADKLTYRFVTSGQNRNMTLINESGLYSLILSSKMPQAKLFRRWVTSEILPSVRKFGAYVTGDPLEEMFRNPKFAEALIDALQEEHSKNNALERQVKSLQVDIEILEDETRELENEAEVLKTKVETLSPKASYCERVLDSGEALQTSIIAKEYGLSAIAFNRLLHDLGIQYKIGREGTWLLYQKYAGKGYTKTKTYFKPTGECVVHSRWTQKGRQFLYEFLALYGIYPIAEAQLLLPFGDGFCDELRNELCGVHGFGNDCECGIV